MGGPLVIGAVARTCAGSRVSPGPGDGLVID
jgi:hypothetical protein